MEKRRERKGNTVGLMPVSGMVENQPLMGRGAAEKG